MAALQGYTIELYRELEAISGQSCGLHHVGGLTIATSQDRMDFLKAARAKHRYMELNTEIIGPDDISDLAPIVNIEGVIGALYDPLDGHLDPSGTTHAYARAATQAGAEIVLRNPVLETNATPNGGWEVVTQGGTVHAEHVVNAGGLWAREVGALAGVYLPLHPMEHQYLVTEEIPQVYEREKELPHVMDPAGENYLRQEGRGLVIGFYEQNCTSWAVDGTPLDFGHELLADNLDRIESSMETAFHRYPVLERAGIKNVINGPFTFAPDGNPLVGPVPHLQNYWAACAVMAGFSQGGGVGLTLAEWMVIGEPSRDVFAMDVARFGDWITPDYTRTKVRENYQRRFSVSYPNEELPAARPFQATPAYEVWKEQRAVFGSAYGMEVVNYFAPSGEPLEEIPSFRRSNAHLPVSQECQAVRTAVGINEVHNFGKYLVEGDGARSWLDCLMAGRIPKPGRVGLTPMLSPSGKVIGDFTVSCLAENLFFLVASFSAQAYHMRWFIQNLPKTGVSVRNVSTEWVGFQIAGPDSRRLLASVVMRDVSNTAFPFLAVDQFDIGICRAHIQRISYTGDLGYEIYVDQNDQIALYEVLREAGTDFQLKPFGMRAMNSLRLEKSFGAWMREYRPDYMPVEVGLDPFIEYEKTVEFIGKTSALQEREDGVTRRLCTFVVNANDADVHGDEPIWVGDNVAGFATSGGFSHYIGESVALGFLPVPLITEGREVEIEILGDRRKAILKQEPLFDPQGMRMRS
jgi:dimethylglycine dehydrogenase